MKRVTSCLLFSLLLVVSSAGSSFAKGVFITPGARASGMGGAFVAVADDLSTVFYNPAGITQLEGNNVMLSAFSTNMQTKSNTSISNSATPNTKDNDFPAINLYAYLNSANPMVPNAEPAMYNNKKFDVNALLPYAAGNFRIDDKSAIAVAVYAIGGGGGKWQDTVASQLLTMDTVHASISATKGFVISNVSYARDINKELSLAVGLDYIYMIDQTTFLKEYTKGTASPQLGSYTMHGDYDAAGGAFEGVIGALYRLSEKSKLGCTLRTGADIKLSGKGTATTSGLATITGGLVSDTNISGNNYTSKYNYPMTAALGYSYKQSDKLLLAFEYNHIAYGRLKNETTYDTQNALFFVNTNAEAKWKDQTRLHLGGEYTINDAWKARAGLSNDPETYSFAERTLLDTFMYNLILLDVGAGFSKGSFVVNADMTTNFSDTQTRNGREYEFPGTSFRFDIGYRFN